MYQLSLETHQPTCLGRLTITINARRTQYESAGHTEPPFHDNSGAGIPILQVEEEAPLSFLMLSRTGSRVIIQPWVGRASRPNLRGVTSTSFFPQMTSLMTNAPFSRRPAM